MNKSKYQKFTVETINRSEIKNAEYNPRFIDEKSKKKLRKALKDHGLVETLIWNKTTGNLVGGHQRLEQLDALEGNKDYSLDVSVIEVDVREEAVINVQLNNPSMQGEWDIDKLADLKLDFDIDFSEFGFDQFDVDVLFNADDRFTELFDPPEVEATKEEIDKVREARGKGREIMEEAGDPFFYAMVVFENSNEKADFFRRIHVPVHEEVITVQQIERIKKEVEDE